MSWACVIVAASALMLGAVGCGGSDDDGGAGGGAGAGAQAEAADRPLPPDAVEPRTPVEEEIHAVYREFTDAMTAQDPKGACASLTPRAQRRMGDGISCERRVESLLAGETGKPSYIARLKVEGDRAIAGTKTRTSNVYTVEFRKHEGQWKINGDEE